VRVVVQEAGDAGGLSGRWNVGHWSCLEGAEVAAFQYRWYRRYELVQSV
jgi:hypothetical protein